MTEAIVRQEPPAAQPPPRARMRGWRRVLLAVLFGILALLVAYTAGRLQTASRIDDAEARTARAEGQQRATSSDVQRLRRAMSELEARRELHLTTLAMEERNFGIAQRHLERAARLLREGLVDPESTELTQKLSEVRLQATEDLGPQREALLTLTHKLDDRLDRRGIQ